jgi:NADP-dependent 3-hydroxy acid dehydrogenase YdfG
MGSVAATYPYQGGSVYGASKAFVRQFSLNLRADLLGTPIRVTCIDPGMAETEFSVTRFRGDLGAASKVYEGMKPLSAEDIADVVEATVRLPAHVNLNAVEVMPVSQAFAGFAVDRSGG